jgi:hypothetical protein
MYATCLFCRKDLGRNETFERFPVGRRLAFDAAKGRLWVVCGSCERWNLTPLEERWEVVEEAERLYRDSRQRVATDHIGLAKLRDGTVLVRIGEPLRPEFAAWRYGDQFGRRRKRQILIAGAGVTAIGALMVGGAAAGVGIGGFGWLATQSGRAMIQGRREAVVARIQTEDASGERRTLRVRRRHLGETSLDRDESGSHPFALDLRFAGGRQRFEGPEAARIAAIVIPQVNRFGGAKQTIADAVTTIEASGGAAGFLERTSKASRSLALARQPKTRRRGGGDYTTRGLFALPAVERLALEMALHEEDERRVAEGELGGLERAWREAEEIAAIADDMFVPGTVRAAIDRMRGK